jgi:hypothetical protein
MLSLRASFDSQYIVDFNFAICKLSVSLSSGEAVRGQRRALLRLQSSARRMIQPHYEPLFFALRKTYELPIQMSF